MQNDVPVDRPFASRSPSSTRTTRPSSLFTERGKTLPWIGTMSTDNQAAGKRLLNHCLSLKCPTSGAFSPPGPPCRPIVTGPRYLNRAPRPRPRVSILNGTKGLIDSSGIAAQFEDPREPDCRPLRCKTRRWMNWEQMALEHSIPEQGHGHAENAMDKTAPATCFRVCEIERIQKCCGPAGHFLR